MQDPDRIERVRRALEKPASSSSDFDLNPRFERPNDAAPLRQAAVLIGISDTRQGAGVILTKRASGLRHHPGQIAFPGGKVDPGDPNPTAAALREANEEVGLPVSMVQIMGTLPPHETVTGFMITPVIGLISGRFDLVPEPGEVDEAFIVPLSHLADPARYRVERRMWRGVWRNYYAVPWGPYYIWGATARILRGLAERLQP